MLLQLVDSGLCRACKEGVTTSVDQLKFVGGVAVDWVTHKLYFAVSDLDANRIEVSDVDGGNRSVLVWDNISHPIAVAVDAVKG